jgi:trimethylamine:corrinoid methyltransferase-like protein
MPNAKSPKKAVVKPSGSAKKGAIAHRSDSTHKSEANQPVKLTSPPQVRPGKSVKPLKIGAIARLSDPAVTVSRAAGVRLSDPEMKKIMANTVRRLSNHDEALRFLREIGMATPTGRLTKRYGG